MVALSSLRFPFSPFLHWRWRSTSSIRYCSVLCSSSSSSSSSVAVDSDQEEGLRWESFRKKRVVMRVGYVGTDYRGLQKQHDSNELSTIEAELESAIFKSGGILPSNFGNLHRIGWTRSSRTDKGVHSLATMISLKMEIPIDAWSQDLEGISLAKYINSHLPKNIRVFSVLPSTKNFDARRECVFRKYLYLLPAKLIGIENNSSSSEIENHLSEFNSILKTFEGEYPFHNYTVRSRYRKQNQSNKSPKKRTDSEPQQIAREKVTADVAAEEDETPESSSEEEEEDSREDEKEASRSSSEASRARWLYEPDESDRLSRSHFRKIINCFCGPLERENSSNLNFVEVNICGESFMLHQIRKMVGTAVAVKRNLIPKDIIDISLTKFSRIVLPIAPSEVLILRDNSFFVKPRPGTKPGNEIRLEESDEVRKEIQDFYSRVLVNQVSGFLDPVRPPWSEWVEKLVVYAGIPDLELKEVRSAYRKWREGFVRVKCETIGDE
ncbi:hypothetical protein LUZ60_013112 [Juncus effusus]|nr:hypothetical protein LUZ60_013112 [Juncus effusus]